MTIFVWPQRPLTLPANQDTPARLRTRAMPGVVWIELTSRCPFDCVFCSRKLLRGNGQHMKFEMLEKLIGELGQPEIIRLNYSGESSHYPQIVEACELASATGARVELVSALASLPWHRVERLAQAGLARLTVSLHTLDEQRFGEIYRFSNVQEMRARIERIAGLSKTAKRPMELDFAFVAMRRNLGDLVAVADYAAALGITRVDIHPVIRRDPIPETFEEELDGERLKPSFLADLRRTIESARQSHQNITFNVSTPELREPAPLSDDACAYPWPLQSAAQIHGCEQDPWNTVHVLAGGEVVTCEARDQIVMGRLGEQSFGEIWNSQPYAQFRDDYFHARDAKCRGCPYKFAARPRPLPQIVHAPDRGRSALVYGWHSDEQEAVFWSHRQARLALSAHGAARLKFRCLLPPGAGDANRLSLKVNGVLLKTWRNDGVGMMEAQFDRRIQAEGQVILELETSQAFCPQERGGSADTRQLGVALLEASLS